MGAVFSLIAITAGAILRYATTVHSKTWNVGALGDILMIAGGVGLVVACIAEVYWERAGAMNNMQRKTIQNTEIHGVVHGPTGYARTSYDANYPNVGAVPTTVVEEETSVL